MERTVCGKHRTNFSEYLNTARESDEGLQQDSTTPFRPRMTAFADCGDARVASGLSALYAVWLIQVDTQFVSLETKLVGHNTHGDILNTCSRWCIRAL